MKSLNAKEPSPNKVDGPAIWDLVIADMRERDKIGTATYKQRLKAGDGRNSLVDTYQEVLDTAAYLRKEIIDKETLLKALEDSEAENVRLLELIALAEHASNCATRGTQCRPASKCNCWKSKVLR